MLRAENHAQFSVTILCVETIIRQADWRHMNQVLCPRNPEISEIPQPDLRARKSGWTPGYVSPSAS